MIILLRIICLIIGILTLITVILIAVELDRRGGTTIQEPYVNEFQLKHDLEQEQERQHRRWIND